MIYQFRIISDEQKEFAREILISSSQSFLEFHRCLQENLGYDPDQLASFFITNHAWEKQLQITLIDMMDNESETVTIMDEAILKDHIRDERQRLLYVFDFFSERSFFIELTEVIDKPDSNALPRITFSHGDPPKQIDLGLDDLDLGEHDSDDDNAFGIDEDDLGDGFNFTDPDDL